MRTELPTLKEYPQADRRAGFTLVELLVAVTVTTLIIFALYKMFDQTQKALQTNVRQVDVMESGRATMELLTRDLEQLRPSGIDGCTNLFYGMLPPFIAKPMPQTDPEGNVILRTNLLNEFFFLSRRSNMWVGTGYRFFVSNGIGRLYRFSAQTNYRWFDGTNLARAFFNEPIPLPGVRTNSGRMARVADGIIHLKLTTFDPEGWRMGWDMTNEFPGYQVARLGLADPAPAGANVVLRREGLTEDSRATYLSNAVPAFVELELGILDPKTLREYQALGDAPAKVWQDFLKKRASSVQLFRQRIPIRTETE